MNKSINDRLDKALEKWHAKLNCGLTLVENIYHFTDFEGLKGILTSQKLRFTDYRYLNDPTELEFCKDIILDEMFKHNLSPDQHRAITFLFDKLSSIYNVYISCFSTEKNKLSLWRYYANNGTGFAIGFRKNFFWPDENLSASDNPHELTVCKINYCKKRTKKIVKGFFDEFCKICPTEGEKEKCFIRLLTHLIRILPAIKDESFCDEQEIRLYCTDGSLLHGKDGRPIYFDEKDRAFIPIKKKKLPFVNIIRGNKPVVTPEKFQKEDIVEILVGPSCNFIEAKTCIRSILQNNDYTNDVPINFAKLPFQLA
ncbi:DUF2971 domain-containing protein [Legionella sainthelensi]|uniref:DUF2971 domain-containing protein n=1 Tax=Legionella sainthelensi TaxID=28087 RepID=UPI000E204B59|nr:DUF2971 domain-containing protein [Legionella sainthelensi]